MHKDHELFAEEVRLLKKRPDLQPVSWKPESRERDDGQENPSFLLMLKNLYNQEVFEAEKLQELILAKQAYNEKSLITGAPQLPRGEIPRLQARLERHIETGKFFLKILDLTVRNFYTDQNSRKSVYPRRANVLAMLGLTLTLPFASMQRGCDDLNPPKPLSIPQEEEDVPTIQPVEQPTIAIATAIPPATGEAATPEAEQETQEQTEQPQATPHEELEKFITATLTPESTLTQEGVQSEQTRLTDGTIVITKIKDGMVVAIATATPTETGIADEILYGTDTAQMALNAAGYPDKIVAQLKIVEFQLEGGFAAHRVEASDAEGNLLATVAPPTDIWILAPEPTIPVTPENPAESGQGLEGAIPVTESEMTDYDFVVQRLLVNSTELTDSTGAVIEGLHIQNFNRNPDGTVPALTMETLSIETNSAGPWSPDTAERLADFLKFLPTIKMTDEDRAALESGNMAPEEVPMTTVWAYNRDTNRIELIEIPATAKVELTVLPAQQGFTHSSDSLPWPPSLISASNAGLFAGALWDGEILHAYTTLPSEITSYVNNDGYSHTVATTAFSHLVALFKTVPNSTQLSSGLGISFHNLPEIGIHEEDIHFYYRQFLGLRGEPMSTSFNQITFDRTTALPFDVNTLKEFENKIAVVENGQSFTVFYKQVENSDGTSTLSIAVLDSSNTITQLAESVTGNMVGISGSEGFELRNQEEELLARITSQEIFFEDSVVLTIDAE